MKNGKWMAVIGSGMLAGFVTLSGVVMARDGGGEIQHGTISVSGHDEAAYPSLATVTFEQAVQKASEAVPGSVLKTQLEDENGFLVYGIEMVTPDRKVMEIKVDAGSGEVLAMEPDEQDDEKAEKNDELEAQENTKG
ncbi:MAG: PepSY domain-containing protein [Deltaproteobacteria bacterium]